MKIFPLIVVGFLSVLPRTAEAAPFLNPIVPEACQACPCGFGGVLQIIQNLMNFGIGIAIIFATIIIAWGGFLYIMSSANPESRSKANKMLINAAIGLLVVLSAWLIVDFVMKSLYDGETSKFGPWNTIIGTSGDVCIEKNDNVRGLYDRGVSATPGGGGNGENCPVPAESTMVAFPSEVVTQGTGKATRTTVDNFMAMRAAALEDGIDLKIRSAYRSEAAQIALWHEHGEDRSRAAKPCTLGGEGSNHNSGTAIDIDVGCGNPHTGCNTPTYRWLKANGHRWNFRNAIPTDPPHWSPSGR